LLHSENSKDIDRLIAAIKEAEGEWKASIKELEEKLETYVPPVIHWVGELKTGALGALSVLCIALIVKLAS
jgi:hypothetical protein